MSFSHKFKTLRSRKNYDLQARPEMSIQEEETTMAAEMDATEGNDGTSLGFSPDMIEEEIKANFDSLLAQISALTQMMDRIIQGNLAREFTTASTRETRFPSESSLTDGPGNSRTPPIAPMTAAGYSPDTILVALVNILKIMRSTTFRMVTIEHDNIIILLALMWSRVCFIWCAKVERSVALLL